MVNEVEGMPWEGEYPAAVAALMIRHGAETLGYTKRFYEVRNVRGELILGAGVAVWSFVRPPEIWLMLAKPYFADLRKSLSLTRVALGLPASQYPGLICEVDRDSVSELHFAKHVGFTPTGQPSTRPNPDRYIQFKVA